MVLLLDPGDNSSDACFRSSVTLATLTWAKTKISRGSGSSGGQPHPGWTRHRVAVKHDENQRIGTQENSPIRSGREPGGSLEMNDAGPEQPVACVNIIVHYVMWSLCAGDCGRAKTHRVRSGYNLGQVITAPSHGLPRFHTRLSPTFTSLASSAQARKLLHRSNRRFFTDHRQSPQNAFHRIVSLFPWDPR